MHAPSDNMNLRQVYITGGNTSTSDAMVLCWKIVSLSNRDQGRLDYFLGGAAVNMWGAPQRCSTRLC